MASANFPTLRRMPGSERNISRANGAKALASAWHPIWVAGLALVDQGLFKHHKHAVGVSPAFYRIVNQHSTLPPTLM